MTAVGDTSVGGVADALMSGVGSDYRLCVEFWRDRAHMAEQELKDLLADVEASTAVDLLKRYRRVCAENQAMRGQLELWLRGHPMTVERWQVVASLVNGAAASARAQAKALRGNR